MCVRARIALVLKLDYLSTIVCQQLKNVFSAAPSIYSSRANRAWGVDRWRYWRRLQKCGHVSCPVIYRSVSLTRRKFRNGERNLHCDVVHITTKWVSSLTLDCNGVFAIKAYRSFHVYQHVTSFSHMRGALVGRRTTAAGFHMQNMCNVWTKTLEYRSKYTHILNPTVREDIRWQLWQIVRFVLCSKKRQNELSREPVCSKLLIHGPATLVTKYKFILDYKK